MPIIAPVDAYEDGKYKERVSFLSDNSVATVLVRMNLGQYLDSNEIGRIKMYKDMISNKKVKGKGKFDYDAFCKDLDTYTNSKLLG